MENQKPNELNKNLAVVCGTIIAICVIISGVVLYRGSHPSSGTTNVVAGQQQQNNQQAPQQQQPAPAAVDINKVNIAGNPFIGNPNASVTIAYWFDYQCPFCKRNEQEVMPQIISDYVNTGKVKIVYKDYEFLGADSQTIGQFARAVWAVAPTKFGAWHKAMFDNQGTENTGWATHDKIMSITTSAIGAANAAKADQLVTSNGATYQKEMDADKAEGTSFGISGTPGTIIGKQLVVGAQPYSAFKAAIDQALAGK